MRKESDALGQMMIADEIYYGIHTERARLNFDVSGRTIEDFPDMITAIARIKKAAALANWRIGALEKDIAEAIAAAADEVTQGRFAGHFPLDPFQGGGGTSTNMNVNEVLANRANEILTGKKDAGRIHPNTHVNMGQSTNDVIPSAMNIAARQALYRLKESLQTLQAAFAQKAEKFQDVVKVGRTCLQDAVPLTLGQEFGGYASFLDRQISAISSLIPECTSLTMGGTAVGTGLGCHKGFVEAFYAILSTQLKEPMHMSPNLFDSMQNADLYLTISSMLKKIATGLSKISADLRLLSSGPRAGLGEIRLPAVQAGSSIMPGKINPVIPEMMIQIGYQVCGNDASITMAVEGGELDLNVWEPLLVNNLMESFRLLTKGAVLFAEKCVSGISADRGRCWQYAHSSLALSTVVAAERGYPEGARLARHAAEKGLNIHQAVQDLGLMDKKQADAKLDPMRLVAPER